MKRLFTLLVALGLLTAADAQRGNRANRGRVGVSVSIGGNNGIYQTRIASDRFLQQQIFRINQKYDQKIRDIRFNRYMRPAKKAKKIHNLEHQRQQEINRAYANARYNNNRYGHSPRRY